MECRFTLKRVRDMIRTYSQIKKLLYEAKKKKKKHNKIIYLGKNKLDCVEMLISQAIIDQQINHNEFKMIIHEKKYYDN